MADFYLDFEKPVKVIDERIIEMETSEENHRVEVRVYIQKVKHLQYEHKNNLKYYL